MDGTGDLPELTSEEARYMTARVKRKLWLDRPLTWSDHDLLISRLARLKKDDRRAMVPGYHDPDRRHIANRILRIETATRNKMNAWKGRDPNQARKAAAQWISYYRQEANRIDRLALRRTRTRAARKKAVKEMTHYRDEQAAWENLLEHLDEL